MSDSGIDILLHNHLDGSRPMLDILPYLFYLTHGTKKNYPFDQWRNHHEQIKKWFANPLKEDIVHKFSVTTGVMQNYDTIYFSSKNYVETRAYQGFKYCEIIMAPQYCTFLGLTIEEAILAMVMGIIHGEIEYPDIEVNILLAVGREVEPEKAVELVESFANFKKNYPRYSSYIAGVTLVCDEAKYPPQRHIQMFKRAKELSFKTACHTGEWVNHENQEPDFKRDLPLLLENCWTSVEDLRVDRIEHGRPIAYDEKLIKVLHERNIGVTSCPGSYICSGLLPDNNVEVLKLTELLGADVLLTIDSDDDLFMDDIDEVFNRCNSYYHFTEEQKLKLRLNAWKIKFGNRKVHDMNPPRGKP